MINKRLGRETDLPVLKKIMENLTYNQFASFAVGREH